MLYLVSIYLVASDGKESACKEGDPSLIPGLGSSPGGGRGNPLQSSCLENPHGQRSLVGYSPRGCKESDTTERLSISIVCMCMLTLFKEASAPNLNKTLILHPKELLLVPLYPDCSVQGHLQVLC